MSAATTRSSDLPVVLTSLLRGVVYRESNETLWRDLLALQAQVRDTVALLGLQLIVDEGEGYAYLRSQPDEERDERIPRLIQRRELPFDVSVLLAVLRGRLAQFDAEGGQTRLVVTRDEMVDLLRVFLESPTTTDARLVDRVDTLIRRVVDLGFLRPVRVTTEDAEDADTGRSFEVRRILKAFVDAQWLADFDTRLAEYQAWAADRSGVKPSGTNPPSTRES